MHIAFIIICRGVEYDVLSISGTQKRNTRAGERNIPDASVSSAHFARADLASGMRLGFENLDHSELVKAVGFSGARESSSGRINCDRDDGSAGGTMRGRSCQDQ
jgi:hypothetical protein